ECPTGVDMAKMKVEFLHHYRARHGVPLRDRLVAYLPRYAALAARSAPLSNWMQSLARGALGFSRQRQLPQWRSDFVRATPQARLAQGTEVVLFVDTFNRYFEPENTRAALRVLEASGYRVQIAEAAGGGRPLCCGRTFLENGLIEPARFEARRVIEALRPWVERGVPVV